MNPTLYWTLWVLRPIIWVVCLPFRALRWAWERITPEGAKKAAYIAVAMLALVSIYSVKLQREASASNRVVIKQTAAAVALIKEQTSPEAEAKQRAAVEDFINIVDCNQRQALQDALQGLVRQGILSQADVVTITNACTKSNDETPVPTVSTTTTAPSGD